MHPSSIVQLSAKAVKDFVHHHRENEYCLIDVREPQEYEDAHIPGALHFPLMRVLSSPDVLPHAAHMIFYCRSGRRSMRAAQVAARFVENARVYNMMGGILAWNGTIIPALPAFRLFDVRGSLEDLLQRALELEHGAHVFYTACMEKIASPRLHRVIAAVTDAEEHHTREVYDLLAQRVPNLDPFDQVVARLPDTILESGHTYDEVFKAASMLPDVETSLLEIAIEVEAAAFDLYRTVAEMVEPGEARTIFLELAHAEKHHAEFIARALAGGIASD